MNLIRVVVIILYKVAVNNINVLKRENNIGYVTTH